MPASPPLPARLRRFHRPPSDFAPDGWLAVREYAADHDRTPRALLTWLVNHGHELRAYDLPESPVPAWHASSESLAAWQTATAPALDAQAIQAIRAGEELPATLAARHGRSRVTISLICSGRLYAGSGVRGRTA